MSNQKPPRLAGLTAPPEDTGPRPPVREADPRAEAARRAAEIRENMIGGPEGEDKFYIPHEQIPEGWSYEWKRHTVLGKEDPSYDIALARNGWTSVPTSRHPEMMPSGFQGPAIIRDGMMLMERPEEITREVRAAEAKRARAQVRAKEEQLNEAPAGTFERDDPKGQVRPKIKKSYEPVPISD